MKDLLYYHKFKAAFEAKKDLHRASRMKAYLKDHFEFYGIPSPERKLIVRQILNEFGKPDIDELMGITGLLWADPHREMQYVVMDITNGYLKKLDKSVAPFYDKLIGEKSWWDSVDWLAPKVLGTLFHKHPELQEKYLQKWMASGNRWYIRSAILFQLKYKEKTDFRLLTKLILQTAGTNEFFINKASGWALREYSKTDPTKVIRFIDEHNELHNLTVKEGLKWLQNR